MRIVETDLSDYVEMTLGHPEDIDDDMIRAWVEEFMATKEAPKIEKLLAGARPIRNDDEYNSLLRWIDRTLDNDETDPRIETANRLLADYDAEISAKAAGTKPAK